jgi:hypothetical protein
MQVSAREALCWEIRQGKIKEKLQVKECWIRMVRSNCLFQQVESTGIDVTNTVAYWFIPLAANVLYGEGKDV